MLYTTTYSKPNNNFKNLQTFLQDVYYGCTHADLVKRGKNMKVKKRKENESKIKFIHKRKNKRKCGTPHAPMNVLQLYYFISVLFGVCHANIYKYV